MTPPQVAIFLGSKHDAPVAEKGTAILDDLAVPWTIHVASAHAAPEHLETLVAQTPATVLIAIADVAAALPGLLAAQTTRPVVGVPVSGPGSRPGGPFRAIVQTPAGTSVAAVGLDRGDDAALLAATMLGMHDERVREALERHRAVRREQVLAADRGLRAEMGRTDA